MDNTTKEFLAYREALCSIFESPKGQLVKKTFKKMYVEQTALGDTPYQTHYLLGQKELIQQIINDSENPIKQEDLLGG